MAITTQGRAMIIETLIDNLFFPESPRWHNSEQKWYFSDILNHRIHRMSVSGKLETVFTAPNWISGLGWLENGDLLGVMMHEQRIVRLAHDYMLAGNCQAHHCHTYTDLNTPLVSIANDLVMLPDGTTYTGSFQPGMSEASVPGPHNRPRLGYIIMTTPNGNSHVVEDNTCFPNGLCLTPDHSSLIVAETFGYALTMWDIQEDRLLCNRRPFAYLGAAPDGICIDAEGCVWVACPYFQYGDSGGYVHVAEGGKIKQVIEVTDLDKSAYACQLGGPDGCDLLLCESTVFGRERQLGDGRIRITRVDVPAP